MNIKTLKVLKKYSHMIIPGKKFENIMLTTFEAMSEKDKEKTLKEIKLMILLHNN